MTQSTTATPITTAAGFTQHSFDAFLQSRAEPDWLRELRVAAWRKFGELPMPGRQDEEWMRTDIRTLRLDRFGLAPEPPADAPVPPGLLTEGVELAGQTIALDSHSLSERVDPKLAAKGVLFGSLDRLACEHPEIVRPHLFRAIQPGIDKFAALHGAWWSGGTLLYVPQGVVIKEPLHMLSALSAGAADLGHTLVILEDGA